jgi:hypothetical protein
MLPDISVGAKDKDTFDPTKITVAPAPPTRSGEVKVDADVVVAKYPVKIHGTVTATLCK